MFWVGCVCVCVCFGKHRIIWILIDFFKHNCSLPFSYFSIDFPSPSPGKVSASISIFLFIALVPYLPLYCRCPPQIFLYSVHAGRRSIILWMRKCYFTIRSSCDFRDKIKKKLRYTMKGKLVPHYQGMCFYWIEDEHVRKWSNWSDLRAIPQYDLERSIILSLLLVYCPLGFLWDSFMKS